MSHHTTPTPYYRQLSPHFVWQHYFHPFERELLYGYITIPILKSKGETCMVQEPSHVKQLSPIHVCKIGLTCQHVDFFCRFYSFVSGTKQYTLTRIPYHQFFFLLLYISEAKSKNNSLNILHGAVPWNTKIQKHHTKALYNKNASLWVCNTIVWWSCLVVLYGTIVWSMYFHHLPIINMSIWSFRKHQKNMDYTFMKLHYKILPYKQYNTTIQEHHTVNC
jgi:hypothetical protein